MIEVGSICRGDDEGLVHTIKAESDVDPGYWYTRAYTDPLVFLYELMEHLGNSEIKLEILKPSKGESDE